MVRIYGAQHWFFSQPPSAALGFPPTLGFPPNSAGFWIFLGFLNFFYSENTKKKQCKLSIFRRLRRRKKPPQTGNLEFSITQLQGETTKFVNLFC